MLEIKDLTIHAGKKAVCRNFSFHFKKGKTFGIIGPNGCGKTSLLHTLAGLRIPTNGSILLSGNSIHRFSRKKIAKEIGILLQDTAIFFPQTVFEYCLAARYPHIPIFSAETVKDKNMVMQALRQVDLLDQAQCNAMKLSGGEKRRLAIAALLAQQPQIYLLDEPTNHLDLRYQITLLTHFKSIPATKIMVLHDINLAAKYCDEILLMLGDGEISAGSAKTILTTENLLRAYGCHFRQMEYMLWETSDIILE